MPAGLAISGKNYKRKYRSLRSKWYNKKYSVGDIAARALKGVMYLKTLVNSEMKLFTQQNASVVQSYNGNVIHLTNITQGDTTANRNGRSILINYLQLRGIFTKNAGNDTCRWLVIRDKYQTGTAPSVDQVLQTVGTSLAPYAPLDASFAGRFEILDTGMVTLSADRPVYIYKKFIRLNKHCKWQTVADGGGTMSGHIYFVSLNNVAASGNTIEFVSRVGFRDN